MAVKALNDAGGWGQALVNEAKKQGLSAELVESADKVNHDDLFFARIAQKKDRREKELPEIIMAKRKVHALSRTLCCCQNTKAK